MNWVLKLYWSVYWFLKYHKLAYCHGWRCHHESGGCGIWTLCRLQSLAYSTSMAYMCRECSEDEQAEVDAAWAEYHSSVL